MPSDAELLLTVEASWVTAFGPIRSRGSVSFVGVLPIDVLRFGPDDAGTVRYATVGMARTPMADPSAVVVDAKSAPRAELVLALAERRDSVLRTMAVLASAPAVEGIVLVPDSTVDTGQALWDGSVFTAVLVDVPDLADVAIGTGAPIRLLPVIPVTATELAYRRTQGAAALRAAWQEAGTDLLDPGRSPAR
ncbi:MAG: suppressor of fused domain protein [Geodermatophilaceae bacterium]